MSTVRSTPPVVGFNDQTYHDPFFPSSPSEEQLIPITSEPSPDPRSFHTSSPRSIYRLSDRGLQNTSPSLSDLHAQLQQPLENLTPTDAFFAHSAAHEPHDPTDNTNSSYDFLSPNYLSEGGYTESSDHPATPEYRYDFGLEPSFGVTDGLELHECLPEHLDDNIAEPNSADTYHSKESNYTNRASSGAATLASHLMSPVLTDTASPGSRDGVGSPSLDGGDLKGQHITVATPCLSYEESMDRLHRSGQMQRTPALTGSSMGTSPDQSFVPPIARPPSPVVRIESYSRGDSPARAARPMMRSGSKRSRASASSFLAVENDGESSEEEYGTAKYGSPHTNVQTPARTYEDQEAMAEGRVGLGPQARLLYINAEIPNFKDQEENAQLAMRNADVEDWLARSEPGSAVDSEQSLPPPPRRPTGFGKRQRAKSTGDSNLSRANLMRLRDDPSLSADAHIPGPGLLINEESVYEESEDDPEELGEDEPAIPESPPAGIAVNDPYDKNSTYPDPEEAQEVPYLPPLYRAKLWQDPLYDSSDPKCRMQPLTANEAMMRFRQRAGEIDNISRVATWGTRRLSESDLEGMLHKLTFKDDKDRKPKGERRASIFEQVGAKILSKRNSGNKRKESESSKMPPARPGTLEHAKKDSSGSRKELFGSRKESLGIPSSLQKMPSLKKPKSPKINTGSAVAAMGNQFATLGTSGSISATGTASPTNPWTSAKNIMKRSRSRSDLHGGPQSSTNLASIWRETGGPPMPALASPPKVKEEQAIYSHPADIDDDDEDDAMEDKGVTIDFSIRTDPIVPTLDGFKVNVRQINPRLPVYMIDRVAQEQLRRYKKLIDFKVKHVQATSNKKCPSGKHCLELGGEPTYLPSKSSSREPEHSHTGFSITGVTPSDDDVNALAEGIVTPAQFPPGVPMPPVKRLPAEFECSLCFKVKKFHKPSDWSKHVHEDVQPFTCTFATCAEPKSFKRKADWVRHENERHRQLEWWQCNMNDCTHKCYRKDNFVQHLVREHKLPEPKVKTAKASKPAVRGPSTQKTRKSHGDEANHGEDSHDEIDQVWKLVEECRHETPKNPKDEPCKFCGNICNSWKKLTVHLAKHMEQISMPVLNVVKLKDVTPETIISPIEQRLPQQISMSPTVQTPFTQAPTHISPYAPTVEGLGEIPAPFTSLQSQPAYYADPVEHQSHGLPGSYQQRQASTYPPAVPPQNESLSYSHSRGSSYNVPGYFSHENSPSPQFNPVNTQRFPQPHTSGPENVYGDMRGTPTSQPRSTPYIKEDPYQRAYQPQQAYSNTSPEAAIYVYRNPPTSYPQQPTTIPIQYNPIPEMTYSQAQEGPSIYQQQQQQQQHDYNYHQQ